MGEGIGGGRLPRNSRSRMASQKARWRMSHPFQGPAGGISSGMGMDEFAKEPMEHSTGETKLKIHNS